MERTLINHHIHTTGSDGKNSPMEIAEAAVKKGLKFICFTDHNPRNYAVQWGKEFLSDKHYTQITEVQKKFKGKLEISSGIEIDWTEDHKNIFSEIIKARKFDYVMGSVHMLKDIQGDYYRLNFNFEIFYKIILNIGIPNVIKEYYHQIRLLANSGLFDGIAHLDVIKTFNKDNNLFNEDSQFYREEVLKTLDEIKKNDLCIEINTSGLTYGCNAMFPSFWILQEANKRKIPITIGADTHWIERIDANLEEAYELARKAGYKEILKFKNRKSIKIKI